MTLGEDLNGFLGCESAQEANLRFSERESSGIPQDFAGTEAAPSDAEIAHDGLAANAGPDFGGFTPGYAGKFYRSPVTSGDAYRLPSRPEGF